MYLAAHGARTPFLALLALRRPRVLLVVLAPALALVAAARLGAPLLDPATAGGLLALAAAPAALVLAPLAGDLGGRRDTAGALVVGTVVVWVALAATGSAGGGAALAGIQAFGLAAAAAAALPKLRDAILGPLRWLGDGALLLLLISALAGSPPIGVATVGVAVGTLVLGLLAAAAAARLTGRDPRSAMIGSGTRDAGVAIAISVGTAGPAAAGVPLVYAAGLAIGTAAAIARSRARARPGAKGGAIGGSGGRPGRDHLGKARYRGCTMAGPPRRSRR